MRGGETIINENVIGMHVEVYFKEIYQSQPLFADIDCYIRDKYDLVLFDIRKSYWKYKEGQKIGASKGQAIWGDALYFKDPYKFTDWCEEFSDKEMITKIVMACFMSILYGYHDYALCLLNQSQVINRMGTEKFNALKSTVKDDTQCVRYSFKGSGKIWMLLKLLSKVFAPDHGSTTEGWAAGEMHMGSRKKFGIYF